MGADVLSSVLSRHRARTLENERACDLVIREKSCAWSWENHLVGANRSIAERRLVALTVVAVVLATPLAVWWIVGDISEVTGPYADYLFEPPSISRAIETSLGVGAVLAVAASAATLMWAHRRQGFSRRRVLSVVCLLLVGVIAGYGYRVLTAGVSGANIGGGLVLLFGPVMIIGLVIAAIALGVGQGKPPLTKSS